MDNDTLNKRFEIWKYILFMNIGASVTLLTTGMVDLPQIPKPYFPGWYGIWFVVQLASFLPGFILLWGKQWIQIPLRRRLNTIFGYFVITWVNMLSIGITAGKDSPAAFNFLLLGIIVIVAMGYWWLRRKSIEAGSEIFP